MAQDAIPKANTLEISDIPNVNRDQKLFQAGLFGQSERDRVAVQLTESFCAEREWIIRTNGALIDLLRRV